MLLTGLKDRNHKAIKRDTERAFDKFQHPLHSKSPEDNWNRKNLSQHNTGYIIHTYNQR